MYDNNFADPSPAGSGALMLFFWAVMLVLYFYFAFMQFRIASNKTGNADIAWFAFIPILNTVLLIKMASKPMWWFLVLCIPIVNIIAFFVLWMEVAKACGQSAVWGFLTMIPPISFISIFVMAYGSRPYDTSAAPPSRPRTTVHS
ncbi:MAG: DUF5684 domain-containing protein [Candidatus Zixiibacteriota bacterium]